MNPWWALNTLGIGKKRPQFGNVVTPRLAGEWGVLQTEKELSRNTSNYSRLPGEKGGEGNLLSRK